MNCDTVQNQLSDYVDRLLPENERARVAKHLRDCKACAVELAALRAVIGEAARLERTPAPDHLWPRLEAELDKRQARTFKALWVRLTAPIAEVRTRLTGPAAGRRLAAVTVVLLLGILIGRYFLPSQPPTPTPHMTATSDPDYALINQRARVYVEKSKILLLGIVNGEVNTDEAVDLTSETELAGRLVQEASFLKEHLPARRHERIRELVSDLELILLEIANLESSEDADGVELIRSGVRRKALLLKINLFELGAEPAEAAPTAQQPSI